MNYAFVSTCGSGRSSIDSIASGSGDGGTVAGLASLVVSVVV